ncbi:MAG: DinB family protein [Acidobacteriota bacterium]
MKIETVSAAFDANEKAHQKFETVVRSLNDDLAERQFEGEKWSIALIVEHLALVEDAMSRICAKLLSKAEAGGKASDGGIEISPEFYSKGEEITQIKLEAPERVHPAGGKSISESLAMMDESRERFEQMRPAFEEYDCREHKFPHPFFGDLSAAEWLVLTGGHKVRHLRQIQKLVEKSESPGQLEG